MNTTIDNVATEIRSIQHATAWLKPVEIDGIQQANLSSVVGHVDCYVGGNMVRLVDGVVVNLTARGAGQHFPLASTGTIVNDLRVRCLDGVVRILPAGSSVEMMPAERTHA